MALATSKTLDNLKAAFAGESQANRRYLYFAQKADVEGYNDVAAVFRSTAEGETGHAHGHLEFMEAVGDPATGLPIGGTGDNLKAAIAGETHEYTDMYPGMARTARDEGFDEIADWFETLAKAEKSHAGRFQTALSHPVTFRRLSPAPLLNAPGRGSRCRRAPYWLTPVSRQSAADHAAASSCCRLSSARWKRPACDFSAFASVSNQSAISSKPSSRAVRAMPGYMSVYSCVSPAIAAFRLSEVPPMGRPVAGSPTASMNSRWPCA